MGFDTTFKAFNISSTGLMAERMRMEVIANNIANASATRTPEGGPFRRKDVVFETILDQNNPFQTGSANHTGLGGVRFVRDIEDMSELPRKFDPGHPDADLDGFVAMPNVKLPLEMVNLITATRAYEANLKAAQAFSDMSQQALSILKG